MSTLNYKKSIINFNEVPEKYRKYVAIGIGEEVRQQMSKSLRTNRSIIRNLISNQNYKLNNNNLPKIAIPLTYEDILDYVKGTNDINAIFDLEDRFIVEYYTKMLETIMYSTCSLEQKIEAINYVSHIYYQAQESNLDGDSYDDDFSVNAK